MAAKGENANSLQGVSVSVTFPVCYMQRVYGSGITAARIVKQHHSEIFHKGGTSVSSATAGAALYPQSGLPALREGLPFTRAARKDCR